MKKEKETFESKLGTENVFYAKGSGILEEKEITFEITEEMLKFWNEKLEYRGRKWRV